MYLVSKVPIVSIAIGTKLYRENLHLASFLISAWAVTEPWETTAVALYELASVFGQVKSPDDTWICAQCYVYKMCMCLLYNVYTAVMYVYMVSLCCDRNYGFGRTLFVLAYTPVLLLVHLPLVTLLDHSLHIDYLILLLVVVVSPMDTHENRAPCRTPE